MKKLRVEGIIVMLDLCTKNSIDDSKSFLSFFMTPIFKNVSKHLTTVLIIYNKLDKWRNKYTTEKAKELFKEKVDHLKSIIPGEEIDFIEIAGSALTGENILWGFSQFADSLKKRSDERGSQTVKF